jgi:hypothetical protein
MKQIKLNDEQVIALRKSLTRNCNQLEGYAQNCQKALNNARNYILYFDEKINGESYKKEIKEYQAKLALLKSILEQL